MAAEQWNAAKTASEKIGNKVEQLSLNHQ